MYLDHADWRHVLQKTVKYRQINSKHHTLEIVWNKHQFNLMWHLSISTSFLIQGSVLLKLKHMLNYVSYVSQQGFCELVSDWLVADVIVMMDFFSMMVAFPSGLVHTRIKPVTQSHIRFFWITSSVSCTTLNKVYLILSWEKMASPQGGLGAANWRQTAPDRPNLPSPRQRTSWHVPCSHSPWWRHQIETFSALLAICAGNSPVTGEFPAQRPVTRSFDVFFDLRLNKRLSKQSWGWWFQTPSCSLWRHCNGQSMAHISPLFETRYRRIPLKHARVNMC